MIITASNAMNASMPVRELAATTYCLCPEIPSCPLLSHIQLISDCSSSTHLIVQFSMCSPIQILRSFGL